MPSPTRLPDDDRTGPPEDPRRDYAAFLSYSRAVDGKLAPALARSLRVFAKPWYKRGALRIFRDDDSLSASPGLWSSIRAGLDGAEFFILLASPEAAASVWVDREVAHWLASRGSAANVLVVVTGGEIAWDRERRDFTVGTTCVPPALRGAFAEEPRWVDLRAVREERHLSSRTPVFQDVVADLAATLRHTSKEDIAGEDLKRHRTTRRVATAGTILLAVLALLAGTAAVIASRNARVADEQRAVAEQGRREAVGRELAALATGAVARDPRTALRLGIASHDVHPGAESLAVLRRLLTTTRLDGRVPDRFREGSAAFLPDGRTVVLNDQDVVTLWDVRADTPAKLTTLESRGRPLPSPDGRTLVVLLTTEPGQVQEFDVWDVADLLRPTRVATRSTTLTGVGAMAFSGDSRTFAMAGVTGNATAVLVWDFGDRAGPSVRHELDPGSSALSLALSPDGRTLAVGDGERTGVSADMRLTLWDLSSPSGATRSSTSRFDSGGRIGTLLFSASGDLLVAGGSGPQGDTHVSTLLIDVRDRTDPRPLGQPLPGTRTTAMTAAIDRAGTTLATSGGPDRAVLLWDIKRPEDPVPVGTLTGHTDGVVSLSFSPDGRTLITNDGRDVFLWHVGGRGAPLPVGNVAGGATSDFHHVVGVASAFDGRTLVIGDDEATLGTWDVSAPDRPTRTSTVGHGDGRFPTTAVAMSPDGRLVAVAGRTSADEPAVFLRDLSDPADPRLVAELPEPDFHSVTALGFAPDGRALAVGGRTYGIRDGGANQGSTAIVETWDVADATAPLKVNTVVVGGQSASGMVAAVDFSPDGTLLAVGRSGDSASDRPSLLLWDFTDPRSPRQAGPPLSDGPGRIKAVAFSPDGRTLAAGFGTRSLQDSSDGEVVLWDVSTPRNPVRIGRPLVGHGGEVGAIAFAPDGRTLATTGDELDGRPASLMLWDLTDLPRVHPVGHLSQTRERAVTAVAFAPDGRSLMTGGNSVDARHASATLWDLAPLLDLRDREVRLACAVAGGGLDEDEWRRFVPDLDHRPTCPS
ncbi:toll/interleukin-1 receptor domain-containing protein [Saccharothrix longispora]|uniref:WD40 repeat protein n=1 Tax=Saccharothrix longispora TaxID=33920 RepID=A0ABU1PP38_9PSEU|nr:toll/interleukin-1 receptor domain-containing protein [Saccharothrix longispora]MDR6592432.1 WD40 repeat protein [Saccharothrix longispora]